MVDRLVGFCLGLLAVAVAIYVSVRLIEAVASTLVIIVAAIGGLIIVSLVTRLLWRRHAGRW